MQMATVSTMKDGEDGEDEDAPVDVSIEVKAELDIAIATATVMVMMVIEMITAMAMEMKMMAKLKKNLAERRVWSLCRRCSSIVKAVWLHAMEVCTRVI